MKILQTQVYKVNGMLSNTASSFFPTPYDIYVVAKDVQEATEIATANAMENPFCESKAGEEPPKFLIFSVVSDKMVFVRQPE